MGNPIRGKLGNQKISPGALLIASWINVILYAAEFALGLYLLAGWPATPAGEPDCPGGGWEVDRGERQEDRAWRPGFRNRGTTPNYTSTGKSHVRSKWFVIFVLVNDTICTVALCADITLVLPRISSDALVPHTSISLWFTTIWVLTTYLAMTFEQCYFLHRYWSISRNKVVTTILSFLVFCNIVYVIVLDGMLISTLHNPSVFDSIYATIVSCILEALADISISLVLVWKLKSIQSIRISTRKLLHKICLYVVAYGCITATSSVLVLVMWMVNINGYLSLTYFTGRIYSLTVLCNSIFVAGWRAEAAGFNDGNLTAADPPQDINGRRNKRRALNDIDFSLRLEIHSASAPEVAATSSSATFVPSSTIQVTNCGPLSSAGVV